VLDGLAEIRVCTGYQTPDGVVGLPRFASEYYADIKPVYETLPGWTESTLGIKDYDALPANARAYIARIEETVGAPIDIISPGPDRSETIILKDPFG
jgi:adenylosuccinate synthase